MRKADQVADELLREIVAGDLEIGALLPKENELASRFEVNRSVIREAVKLLEVHRLVRPIRKRGTVVLDPRVSISPEVISAMLKPTGALIDRSALRDLLEIRAQLDTQMTAWAAERRTDEDLAKFDRITDLLEASLRDPNAYLTHFEALSFAIAQATRNQFCTMLVHWHQRIQEELGDLLLLTRQPSELHLEGVRMLIELIRQQDVESVRSLVAMYHRWAMPRLMMAASLRNGSPLTELMENVQ